MAKRSTRTAGTWRQEIRDLVSGELDAYIRDVGSAEDYVERILGEPSDPRRARDLFVDALTEHLIAWQPERDDVDAYEVTRTCELISAFTPRVGFSKIFGLLEHWRALEQLATDSPDDLETRFQCLVALEMYYETPPVAPFEDAALDRYLRFLSLMLKEPVFVSYAVRRLLDLGVREFVTPIAEDENLLRIAVQGAIQEWIDTSSTQLLEAAVRACLLAGVAATERLSDVFESEDTVPLFLDQELLLTHSSGKVTIPIPQNEHIIIVYYTARITIDRRRGLKFMEAAAWADDN